MMDVRRPNAVVRQEARLLHFTLWIILPSLGLQRIGLIFGDSFFSIVGPIGLSVAAIYVLSGNLVFHRTRLMLFFTMLSAIVLGEAVRNAVPSGFGGSVSVPSLVQFLLLNGFAVLTFREPLNESRFFSLVNNCLAFLAVFGLLEFSLQFVGLSMFSFSGFIPGNLLIEPFFNVVIPFGTSGYFKANGFFLLEPSIFSQFMALGLIIEIVTFRRLRFLALFAIALMSAVSGTGWLMFVSFMISILISGGRYGIVLAAAAAAIGGLVTGGMDLLFPEVFASFAGRAGELQLQGTSGFLRFTTPWWIASDIFTSNPITLWIGLGAGISEHLGRTPSYEYTVNLPVKLLTEYGLPTFVLYILLIIVGHRTPTQQRLLVPVLVMLLVSGGYQQQAFIIFPALLLVIVARLQSMPDVTRAEIQLEPVNPAKADGGESFVM